MAEIPSTITGATVADVTTWAAARGVTSWAALSESAQSQALTRAWDYLQSLNWISGTFDDGLPDRVETAHIMLTIEEGDDPGVLTPTITRDDSLKRKNLGDGAIEKEWFQGAPAGSKFPQVSRLLSGYLLSSGMNVRMVRG